MANKPQGKGWGEIQLAIAAVAVTATLGFWNLFSTPEKVQAGAQTAQTATPPPPPAPTETAQPTPTVTTLGLRPVKIIFGGQAPQPPVVQVAVAQPPAKKRNGGGNADSTGGASAPVPATSTGSSKP
jgi:hypothetical protein